jgi:HAMP domain-containing protein
MKRKTGKEMRKLMVAVSTTTLLLVLAVIAYFMADVIITTNSNMDENKQKMIEQSAQSLTEISENINNLITSPSTLQLFNQDIVMKAANRDWDTIYEMVTNIALGFYPVEYVGTIREGELVSYEAKSGIDVDPATLSTEPPEGEYDTLDSLGGKEGFYVSAFFPLDLGIIGIDETIYINMIVDRTQELADIEAYFTDQRNDMLLRMSIVSIIAIILSLLLTTFGLRYFTRKYVVNPIEELNRTAEEIADGTFEGEVQVDEESAYAALQGLLRSGQKVLSRMDEEMRE